MLKPVYLLLALFQTGLQAGFAVAASAADTPPVFIRPAPAEPGWESPSLDVMMGRIECLSWARNNLLERFRSLGSSSWGLQHQLLWDAQQASDIFEAENIRPYMDAATQEAVRTAYFGAAQLAAKPELKDTCAIYTSDWFLSQVILGPELSTISISAMGDILNPSSARPEDGSSRDTVLRPADE